ncbi:MAG: YARHG domain-containing protein [Lachnospiraceae bacterium]|nr:YARHG domain-containing protein [Lachnospiraceae bacterium]
MSFLLSGCKITDLISQKLKGGKDGGGNDPSSVNGDQVYPGSDMGFEPGKVYDAGQTIQLAGSSIFISIKDGNEWPDSSKGLGAGEKYISVPVRYSDYVGDADKIPEPEHLYITKAMDGNGNDLGISAPIQPVTDMPASEMDSKEDTYYKEAAAYVENYSEAMEIWALFKVPEDTQECVIEVFLTDDLAGPHSGAFKIKIEEDTDFGTFEGKDPAELSKMLSTDEKPTLEDFAYFTAAIKDYEEYLTIQNRDADYKADNYLGGWKAYMVHDVDNEEGEFEAHLANITIDNFEEEDEDREKGWFDIRVKWYLGFDAQGNVIDESGRDDLVIRRSHFTWNRMNNEEGEGYPDVSFAASYGAHTEYGRGPMDMDPKFQYLLLVVRPDGTALNKNNVPLEFMPGSKTVRVPASMAANMKSSDSSTKGQNQDDPDETGNDRDDKPHYGPAAAAREKAYKESESFGDEGDDSEDNWTNRGPAAAGRDREKWYNEQNRSDDSSDRETGSNGKDSSSKKGYVLADSDTKVLDKSSLKNLSDEDLRLAINEIYARHGRKFKSSELQDYFNDKSWYTPRYEPDEFDKKQNDLLNEVELKNLKTLTQIRSERGN